MRMRLPSSIHARSFTKMKKSQIKMTENIAVLFVFFLLIVFGLIFYVSVMKNTSTAESEKNFALKAIKITQLINFLPELQCSAENIVRDACFDILKIDAFSSALSTEDNKFYYYDYFEFANISVSEIYPQNRTWNLYENLPSNHQENRYLVTYVPISLFNTTAGTIGRYSFGVLKVVVYER